MNREEGKKEESLKFELSEDKVDGFEFEGVFPNGEYLSRFYLWFGLDGMFWLELGVWRSTGSVDMGYICPITCL